MMHCQAVSYLESCQLRFFVHVILNLDVKCHYLPWHSSTRLINLLNHLFNIVITVHNFNLFSYLPLIDMNIIKLMFRHSDLMWSKKKSRSLLLRRLWLSIILLPMLSTVLKTKLNLYASKSYLYLNSFIEIWILLMLTPPPSLWFT